MVSSASRPAAKRQEDANKNPEEVVGTDRSGQQVAGNAHAEDQSANTGGTSGSGTEKTKDGAISGEPGGDGQLEVKPEDAPQPNPAVNTGDNVPAGGLVAVPQALPAPGTGYKCGICGEKIGAENQHYNRKGEVRQAEHSTVMVVAEDWAAKQDELDANKEDA